MKFFSLYFLLLAGLTLSAQAQMPDFMQQARGWFSGAKQKVMNKMFDTPMFSKVNESVRNVFRSGDLSSLDTNTIGAMPEKLWQAVGIGPMLTMGKDKINGLLQFNKIKSQGLKTELQNYMAANVTKEEAVPLIAQLVRSGQSDSSGKLDRASQAKLQLLLSRLGDPRSWNKESITNMSTILFYLPNDMIMKIRDDMALRELNRQVILCVRNGNGTLDPKSTSCPSVDESKGTTDNAKARRMTGLKAWLSVRVYGKPETWSNDTFAMMAVESIPPVVLTAMPANVIASKKSELVTMLSSNSKKRRMIGRDMVEKFMMTENVMAMDSDQVKRFQSSLGSYLGGMVYSTDVSEAALADVQLNATLRGNDDNAIKTGGLNAKMVKSMVQKFARLQNISASQARTIGMTSFSLASAGTIGATVREMNPSKQEMKDLTEGITTTGGPAAKGKLRSIKSSILSVARTNGGLDLDVIPKEMYDMIPLNDYSNMDKNSARNILNDLPESVQPAQISTLFSKLGPSERSALSANAKASLSMSKAKEAVDSLGATAAVSLAEGMPSSSPLGMLAAVETFGKQVVLDIRGKTSLVPFMGVAEAMKVNEATIGETFELMGLAQPTREACFVLKDKFVNNSANTLDTSGEEEAFALLTASDIEDMPPCVVAAFGRDRLKEMAPEMKKALFERVVALEESLFSNSGLPRHVAEMIIREGFNAVDKPMPLTGVDVEEMGVALLLTPPPFLNSLTPDAAPAAIDIINDLAARPIMPCLHPPMVDAMRSMIHKSLGRDPTTWEDISSVCCLLYTLQRRTIQQIPDGSLASCSCDMMDQNRFKTDMEAKKSYCGPALAAEMQARMMVKEEQMSAGLRMIDPANLPAESARRKRAISELSICDRAVDGVAAISQDEINAITSADLNWCLSGLGSKYMDTIKAAALAYKVTQSLTPKQYSSLTAQIMIDMGFILRGISASDIPNLPDLTSPDYNNVIMRLGNPDLMLTQEQLTAYAKKMVETWKKPVSSWTATDIATVNRLLCGMMPSDINQLNQQNFKDAVAFVESAVAGCDMQNVIMPLANKTAQAYGDSAQWTKAQVREMGRLFAGLPPSVVADVDAEAGAGINTDAVKIMPLSLASSMTAGQLMNMEGDSARLFSPEQVSQFSVEKKAALQVTLSRTEASATSVIVSAALIFCATVLTLLL